MTRQEFIDSVRTWSDLLSFCYDYDCNVCENIISHGELAEYIADDFANFSHDYRWIDIRDWLNSIDDNAGYYYRDGSFDYTSVDGDFQDYKDDVLSWCDEDASIFDEDDEDDTPIYWSADLERKYVIQDGDDDIPDCDMSMEDALAFLMDNMPYKISE